MTETQTDTTETLDSKRKNAPVNVRGQLLELANLNVKRLGVFAEDLARYAEHPTLPLGEEAEKVREAAQILSDVAIKLDSLPSNYMLPRGKKADPSAPAKPKAGVTFQPGDEVLCASWAQARLPAKLRGVTLVIVESVGEGRHAQYVVAAASDPDGRSGNVYPGHIHRPGSPEPKQQVMVRKADSTEA